MKEDEEMKRRRATFVEDAYRIHGSYRNWENLNTAGAIFFSSSSSRLLPSSFRVVWLKAEEAR